MSTDILSHYYFWAFSTTLITFLSLQFGYLLKQAVFWKRFLYWLILFSYILLYVFIYLVSYYPYPPPNLSMKSMLGILFFVIPFAVIITFINKWIIEAWNKSHKVVLSNTPVNRVGKRYLIVWIVFPLLPPLITLLSSFNETIFAIVSGLSYMGVFFIISLVWSVCNVVILCRLILKKIEKIALWIPILIIPISIWLFLSGLHLMSDFVALGIVIYLISRHEQEFEITNSLS